MSGPQWIADRSARQAQRRLETSLAVEKERAEHLLLSNHAPEFWQEFLSGLRENILALRDSDLTSSMTTIAQPPRGPQLYSVSVRTHSPFYKQTHTTLEFLLPNGTIISSRAVTGERREIRLVALLESYSVGALWDSEFAPLTAREAAEALIREIVERIDKPAH